MTIPGSTGFDTVWRTPALPGGARLALFRRSRLAVAAGVLFLAAPLGLAAGMPAVAMGLLLAGLLPAAVALDCRAASGLGRAAGATLLILGASLAGCILRGFPAEGAIAALLVAGLEALLVVRRDERGSIAVAASCALAIAGTAMWFASPATQGGSFLLAGLAAAVVPVTAAVALLGGLSDLARRRAAARRRHVRLLRNGGSVLSETVIIVDRKGCVMRAGHNSRTVLGIDSDSLLGRGLSDLTLVADRPLLLTACADAFAGKAAASIRFRLRDGSDSPEPRYRWVELRLPGGRADGTLPGVLRDAGEVVLREAREAEARAAAERAEAARTAFLSTINHELRTPLNAIVGFSELLANPITSPADPTRVREYAGIIHEAGHDLLGKVAAMIDITRIEAGAYEVTREPTDMQSLVAGAADAFRRERGLADEAVTVDPDGTGVCADVDGRAVRGAVVELLSNAFKHGRGSDVRVRVEHGPEGCAIMVSDRGPGVPRDKLAMLAGDLARADETLGRAHGGMGLGLTLARGLMRLHGGSVTIESPVTGGVVVTLRLPSPGNVSLDGKVISLAAARGAGASASPKPRKRKRA